MFRTLAIDAITGYVRHSPIPWGKWRLALRSIGWARTFGPAMGERTISTRHGFKMRLNLQDWVDQHIFATGEYESDVVAVVCAALAPGGCAVDIGANVGFFSLLFSHLVGSPGRVIAFEPQPYAHRRLLANLALNRHLAVEVHQLAASDAKGNLDFYCGPADHSGIASLRDHGQSSRRLTVETSPVDDVLDADQRVHLVKIDVEGAETRVVRGLQKTIARWQPHLVVEVSNAYLKQMGSSATELCERLHTSGYGMFRIGWDGLTECRQWHDGLPDQFNALFTVNTAPFSRLLKG